MEKLRNKCKFVYNNNKDIVFQCLDWLGTNESREIEGSKYKSYEYVIKLFGVTRDGYSVSVCNYNFRPYFFIKVPNTCNNIIKSKIEKQIKKQLSPRDANGIISVSFVKKKEFYGFTNNKTFLFIKLTFKNSTVMHKTNRLLKEGIELDIIGNVTLQKYKIYESNITPFLRFIHTKELNAAGWVKIPYEKYTVNTDLGKKTNCQIDISIDYNDIEFININDISPMLVASFDIECSSSHGDFPLAKKNYKKLACELYDYYRINEKEDSFNIKNKKYKIEFINKQLNNSFSEKKNNNISQIYSVEGEKPEDYIINKLGKILYNIISRKENYKIMAIDILTYFYNKKYKQLTIDRENFLSTKGLIAKYIQYKNNIKSMIESTFCNEEKDKHNKFVTTIFTKTNKKPTKKLIDQISNKCLQQILLLYRKISMSMKEYDLDCDTINDFIQLYVKYSDSSFNEKTSIFLDNYEIEESDIKQVLGDINVCVNMLYSYFEEFPEIDSSRDTYCKRIINKLDTFLPHIEGDKVIQIGTTVRKYGDTKCFLKHIITLKSCNDIENAIVESYETEEEVLLAWTRLIQNLDPDIITGYNIFGFDFAFMYHRAEEIQTLQQLKEHEEGCLDKFVKLGRVRRQFNDPETNISRNGIKKSYLEIKKLASSALGDNVLKYITMDGRIVMDLLKIVQKDYNLVSYKLDYVAETFINDKIKEINGDTLVINGIKTLQIGNFISITCGADKKYKNKKFKIKNIDYKDNSITLNENIDNKILKETPKWTLAKDDVSPKDIFRLQDGSADDRKIVAVYCIQDCVLCNNLIDKLKIVTNNIGMANVCYVPLSYLFLRGQGIKIFSLVSRQCREDGILIPVIKYENEETIIEDRNVGFEYGDNDLKDIGKDDDGYEGAIVLDPKPGIYIETPVTVLDYASLYPSSMISENLSHDSIIIDNDENCKYMGEKGNELLKKLGYGFEDITYDLFKWKNPNIKSQGKIKCGKKTCRFVQPLDGSKSIIPRILQHLLKSRKNKRKKIKFKTIQFKDSIESISGLIGKENETEIEILLETGENKKIDKKEIKSINETYNEFEKSVLDGSQLAFKLTANSLYGQIGAKTSAIHLKDIAASTTATGRKLLYLAKDKVEEHFDGAEIVYGDTDSIFINFNPKNKNNKKIKNKEALKKSIEMGVEAEKYIQPFLKAPHKLEYEKTFWPFILFSKKRYIGNKYEFETGDNDYKQTSMGIVLKRRDNAEIVKHIYGGVIDILMNKKNLALSIKFLQEELLKLMDGKFPLDMLVITKSLRGYYKNPQQIAHKVLADRMGLRDPGNKPSSNDRIAYAYVEVKERRNQNILQGDRIEHIDYIRENNLKPDYNFYITNQIMKPVTQIYALIVEKLEGFKYKQDYFETQYKHLLKSKEEDKAKKKIEDMKVKEASAIIFGEITRKAQNRKNKSSEITDFFKKRTS